MESARQPDGQIRPTTSSNGAPASGGLVSDGLSSRTLLVRLAYAIAIDHKNLVEGLGRIGFQNLRFVDKTTSETRFLGQLARNVKLVDTALLTWRDVSPVDVDVLAPVPDLARVHMTPHALEPRASYEMRIVSRLKIHPNTKAVDDALRAMGFAPSVVVLLGTDRERQLGVSTSVGAWYARATWEKPQSFTTPEDVFFFQQLIPLTKG